MGCVRSKSEIQQAHSTMHVQNTRPESPINLQMTQNVLLIWLDANIDESSGVCQNTIAHFRRAVNDIEAFIDGEECVQFLKDIAHEKVCMIVSGSLGQEIVPRVHDLPQLDSIFIFCSNKKNHKRWAKAWSKIKGVYTKIEPLCEALEQAAQQCEQNTVFISTMAAADLAEGNKDRLGPSYMYTQIMKEILLTINFEQQHIEQCIQYCRQVLTGNEKQLKYVDQLAEQYHQQTPIWWYTCDCFLYSMVNRALRVMDVDLIIKSGFFIRDLHRQIEQLHQEQFGDHGSNQPFTVYRGQGMDKEAFDKIVTDKGGLISFNSFLVTNKNRSTSLKFARSALKDAQTVGVLFVMVIDPAQSSTRFASIDNVSHHRGHGKEILFSMHSVFRIRDIKQIDQNSHLFQVNLELTVATDRDLLDLTDLFRKKFRQHPNGWYNLCEMLVHMHHFKMARLIYEHLLEETPDEREKGNLYRHIGSIKADEGDDEGAITCIETALEILKKTLPLNHPRLAFSYTKIGLVYGRISEYAKALVSHQNALRIYQTIRSSDHPDMALTHNNIGLVYNEMKEFNKALLSYEKALVIYQQSLPSTRLDLAMSYSNIGAMYDNMGDYPQALSSYEEALENRQQILPPTHPDLAVSYNNIGFLCSRMGDYPKALSSHEKALTVQQESLPLTHPDLASSYMGIGNAYYYMGEYPKALSFYEIQLEIGQKSLSPIDPDLACAYMTIGEAYHRMGDYSKALLFDEKALEIQQQSVSSTDPNLALSYNNIGEVYYSTGDYLIALAHHEKALGIYQQAVPATHPDLAYPYNNIGLVYCSIGDHQKSLNFHEKALTIRKQMLSPNHPELAKSYNGIGVLYRHTGDYPKALSSHEDALAIQNQSLPLTHPDFAVTHYNMGLVHESMGDYTEAYCCVDRAVDIARISLPPEHPDLQKYRITLADMVEKLQ